MVDPHYWHGKSTVVLGASSGLGLEIAAQLFAAGANVTMVARNVKKLDAARDAILAKCPNSESDALQVATADLGDDQSTSELFSNFQKLDAVFNAIGQSGRKAIADTSPADFQQMWEVNFLTAVRAVRAALPMLLESKGHFVQIGSLASKSASRYLGAYPATKFPLAAYFQQLRLELQPNGLHPMLVCPGPIARSDAGQRYANQTTDLPDTAKQPGGGVKVKAIAPDWLVQRILQGCQRREAEIVVPAKAKLLFAISQLSATWGDFILKKKT
ncbi:MAG: SDR family NAD(P)-dependent oxidoreductase [Planctomycetales bacterium]|nr:SDR family NAD(P)-dependent oxidoreductase [Planctomycetales bacterium]